MKPMYYLGKAARKTGRWGLVFPAVVVASAGYGVWRATKKVSRGAVASSVIAGTVLTQAGKEIIATPYENAKEFIKENRSNKSVNHQLLEESAEELLSNDCD